MFKLGSSPEVPSTRCKATRWFYFPEERWLWLHGRDEAFGNVSGIPARKCTALRKITSQICNAFTLSAFTRHVYPGEIFIPLALNNFVRFA